MADLESKFTELQGLLSGQHTAMLAALASQQSSLDTIAINSGLQLAALGLIKADTSSLSRLEPIELSAVNLVRLETIQDDILRLRKAMATSVQYLGVDSSENTLLGRLYDTERAIDAVKRIIATDDTYDGLESNTSRLYGFAKTLRDELSGVFSNPDDNLNGTGLSFGDLLSSIFSSTQSVLAQASITVTTLETHTPILQTIADCSCEPIDGGGPTGLCVDYTGTIDADSKDYASSVTSTFAVGGGGIYNRVFFTWLAGTSTITLNNVSAVNDAASPVFLPYDVPLALANIGTTGNIGYQVFSSYNEGDDQTQIPPGRCVNIGTQVGPPEAGAYILIHSSDEDGGPVTPRNDSQAQARYGAVG